MSSSGDDYLDRASGTDSVDDGVRQAILAPILAFGAGIAMLIQGMFDGLANLTDVLGDARDLLGSFLTEGITVISSGADASATAVTDFGIAAFPLGILVTAAGVLVADLIFDDIPLLDAIIPWR